MSDLVTILQENKGEPFLPAAGAGLPAWSYLGFKYLDSLGVKWYIVPPPRCIIVPDGPCFHSDLRIQWMFYWLCYDRWDRHSAYKYTIRQDFINGGFHWKNTVHPNLFATMHERDSS